MSELTPQIEATASRAAAHTAEVWRVLESVHGPRNPRSQHRRSRHRAACALARTDGLHVGLTPTYSGCPATEVIRGLVASALARAGYEDAVLDEVLSPPWSSDWLSEEGRRKLLAFGIAPPAEAVGSPKRLFGSLPVACPRCASEETELVSEFGSTPCKAHYRCSACLEPFDYFKCI